ncbi:amidohydrolase [Nocardia sp. BSTN01]|uniref:amidohydrolase family protein n=1 Tax=Nocardia sp. BSTN01 TaxID=2783665 RepID=UPI00188E5B6B|nr:amidohydrolase family protein [Nocardia sp. BSTN01]MBF4995610.1 amidohydrolase [Nocardia sp. BSTN01]
MSTDYRIIALEEHIVTTEVLTAWQKLEPRWRDLALTPSSQGDSGRRLADIGDERLAAMDAGGIDVQVLSLTAPGVQNLEPADAIVLSREVNDQLSDAVRTRPDRFQAFATLATPAPEAAAIELERAVTTLGLSGAMVFGRTRDRHLDAPEFQPLLETASALRAPLYLHPQSPPPGVREAYYAGFGDQLDAALATHGIGWHYDCGVELLRLILSGVFDRLPDLQVVVGHWGELMLFFLDRIDTNLTTLAGLDRPISDYLRSNVFVTPSGILSQKYLRWTAETLGADRILFAADYPFVPLSTRARTFVDAAASDPVVRAGIGSGNWDRIQARIRR